jgi:NTE family protein
MRGRPVHLVLGSGGARGLAHIGVIEALLERGYTINSIAGCSMGAVVGGMHASGFLPQYKEWMLTMTKSKVFTLLDFTLNRLGFIKGERIFDVMNEFIDVPEIQDFRIPFTAVAANITSNSEVWFREGNLYKALRASIGIPGVFTPMYDGDQILVDGGILNPLPVNAVNRSEGERIIAVNLNGVVPYVKESDHNIVEGNSFLDGIKTWLDIYPDDNPMRVTVENHDKKLSDFLLYAYQMTQDKVVEMMIKQYQPDLVIEFPRNMCGTFDFHLTAELIQRGYEATSHELDTMATPKK